MKIRLEDRVLQYLKENKSITSLEAIKEFGATRLSAIIFNLRKNHNITTQYETSKNRYGDSVSYARYILEGE
jgi:hypothetical protein